ncbi:DUF2273 domain-containing protein [Selenomonas sputigena]|uniref:DUF2273 domain-containing protein n=1 Tax=Selenomonas sputigena TaxID=69823 RepID=A0ABV3X301_9FIRM
MNEESRHTFEALLQEYAPDLKRHRGKVVGLAVGVILGAAILLFGFWQTFFVLLCGLVGLFVGTRFDQDLHLRDVREFFRELFPYGFQRFK